MLFRFEDKITYDIAQQVESKGYAIIDNFLDSEIVKSFREELVNLSQINVMIPNRTHFSLPAEPGKHYLFDKPGLFDSGRN